jgi:hypothetical protein
MRVLSNLRISSQTLRRAKTLVMYWNDSCGGLVRLGAGRTAVPVRIEGCVNRRDASGIGVFDRSVYDRGKVFSPDQAIAQNLVKEADVAGFGLVYCLTSDEMVDGEAGFILRMEGDCAIAGRRMVLKRINVRGQNAHE